MVMAKKKPGKNPPRKGKPDDNPWPDILEKLQAELVMTNAEMAKKFHVSVRTYHGWKYGEKIPGPAHQELIKLAVAGHY
jgi:DNA-binding transcriptional regulator YiaG